MILGVLFVYELVAVVPIHRGDNQREVVDDNGIAVLAEAAALPSKLPVTLL
ncbi:hypothetical protein BABINDRAFT_10093 [Babjeviella inositovora NRRL Y-12698]|uniref:Uncharacterized protein n=1 Tax=Babjeviella inositovora NRRL Y-12698 TaxID=984486 RepID=A0A1E3QID0_9ASCO|nr:uncharacterized protein BABINDRAFT_10093 [Babjeviella inositovora NRRL Y-12698]ODQ77451.1 hypothetical protein BABINDRAFT_10093 [Babjeviella inositovora NRRL Y-12698]